MLFREATFDGRVESGLRRVLGGDLRDPFQFDIPQPLGGLDDLTEHVPTDDGAAKAPDAVEDTFPEYEVEGSLDEDDVWTALEDVEDVELPVSLVDLGLIRDVKVENRDVEVQMTLTYTGCPAKEIMMKMAERRLELLDGTEMVSVELDYSEQWSPKDLTETGRERLGEAGFACSLSGRGE